MNDSFDKTISGGKFDEVFTEVPHTETLGLKNPEQLRLYHLNVNNNAFSTDSLEVFLRRNKVCHLPAPFPVLSFFCQVRWRGVSCPPAPAGEAALSPLAAGVLPGAGTFPGWLAPRLLSRHRPQAGCPCPGQCTAPQRRCPTGKRASASPSWGEPRFSSR